MSKRTCSECDTELPERSGPGRPRKYCVGCRPGPRMTRSEAARKAVKARWAKYYEENPPQPKPKRHCEKCGDEIEGRQRKYCEPCRNLCSVPDCTGKRFGEGLCVAHVRDARRERGELCITDGCDRPRHGKELCSYCYREEYGRGDRSAEYRRRRRRFVDELGEEELRRRQREDRAQYRRAQYRRPSAALPQRVKDARRKLRRAKRGTRPEARVWMVGACPRCGEESVQMYAPFVVGYCSVRCSRLDKSARRRARKREATVTNFRRAGIFARDDYTCQLCGEPLDMDAPRSTDWAPTIDHIIPLARGGAHEEANVQSAHFWCNAVKGDREFPFEKVVA